MINILVENFVYVKFVGVDLVMVMCVVDGMFNGWFVCVFVVFEVLLNFDYGGVIVILIELMIFG